MNFPLISGCSLLSPGISVSCLHLRLPLGWAGASLPTMFCRNQSFGKEKQTARGVCGSSLLPGLEGGGLGAGVGLGEPRLRAAGAGVAPQGLRADSRSEPRTKISHGLWSRSSSHAASLPSLFRHVGRVCVYLPAMKAIVRYFSISSPGDTGTSQRAGKEHLFP